MKLTEPSAIVVAPILNEAIMEALQLTGLISLACIVTITLLYGEILLLKNF